MSGLGHLNSLPRDAALAALARCCGASAWAVAMLDERPFADEAALFEAAERAWAALPPEDRLEAFRHHPRIGELSALREKFASTAGWAAGEQAGAAAASEETLRALAEGNAEYERRFGYLFIVCATGRSAAEMLALLRARLGNPPVEELAVASAEQARITRLRLEKLLREGP